MATTLSEVTPAIGPQPVELGDLPTKGIHDITTAVPSLPEKGLDTANVDEADVKSAAIIDASDGNEYPTEEELKTLRRVSGAVPKIGVALCLVELASVASYYGSTGPITNFLSNPLPDGGNGAGAVAPGEAGLNQSAGALGQGTVTSSALINLFSFLTYVSPILGAILADTKWGRFKAIWVGTIVGFFAHVILMIPAIPAVIQHVKGALGAFSVSILVLSTASGFIKPALAPLFNDQSPVKVPTIKVLKSGERVILDPQVTVEKYTMIFYWIINVGALFAVATSYASRNVGFWLAFLIPGLVYMFMPLVLVAISKSLYKAPPQNSVVVEAYRVFKVLFSNGGWKGVFRRGPEWWNRAKPSHIMANNNQADMSKILWDDKFVDEIQQSLQACTVFFLTPIFVMSDGGIGNSLNAMSVAMRLDGVPNDLPTYFNPIAILLGSPLLTYVLYPYLNKLGYQLKPMTRMSIGCLMSCSASIMAAIIQWRIYQTSPCGWYASTCDDVSTVSLWWQCPIIMLPAFGELFVNVTSYELAYTRAPARMKGLVYAMALFSVAISAAIQLAIANAIQDPYLVWIWTALAVAVFILAILFPTYFKHLNEAASNFADTNRMEGKEQPMVKANGGQVA
ncbi:uncharacterized protein I303_104879 [Kwoniella dejecticola CBS 10117]|uniref:POT family proton-dependent oligopeptide transporter n=1 Tax=Kwoniella dejecticola CBS 10117 TaxID=1296121 RepID=A0A1A6A438_9TREE|nr:uncharacterized protein I303_04137 [Kwoniella dejecticola CBS 10117]OBR84816.1 hypothetical protein I303_04137 [Kwoniella dejecticola CBS 10117]